MEQSCNIVFPIRRRKCYKLHHEGQAKTAYQIADAMIKERNKTKEE